MIHLWCVLAITTCERYTSSRILMKHTWRRPARTALLCLAIVSAGVAWSAGQDHKSWKDYGGGGDNSHFVALDQIKKTNVKNLEVAWTYPTGDDRSYLFNPIV